MLTAIATPKAPPLDAHEIRNAATGGMWLDLADAAARGCLVSAYWLADDIGDYDRRNYAYAFGGRGGLAAAMASWLRLAAHRGGFGLEVATIDAAVAAAEGRQPTGRALTRAAERAVWRVICG